MGRLLSRREEEILQGLIAIRLKHAGKDGLIQKENIGRARIEADRFFGKNRIYDLWERRRFSTLATRRIEASRKKGTTKRTPREDRPAEMNEYRKSEAYKRKQEAWRKQNPESGRRADRKFRNTPLGKIKERLRKYRKRAGELEAHLKNKGVSHTSRETAELELKILKLHIASLLTTREQIKEGLKAKIPSPPKRRSAKIRRG